MSFLDKMKEYAAKIVFPEPTEAKTAYEEATEYVDHEFLDEYKERDMTVDDGVEELKRRRERFDEESKYEPDGYPHMSLERFIPSQYRKARRAAFEYSKAIENVDNDEVPDAPRNRYERKIELAKEEQGVRKKTERLSNLLSGWEYNKQQIQEQEEWGNYRNVLGIIEISDREMGKHFEDTVTDLINFYETAESRYRALKDLEQELDEDTKQELREQQQYNIPDTYDPDTQLQKIRERKQEVLGFLQDQREYFQQADIEQGDRIAQEFGKYLQRLPRHAQSDQPSADDTYKTEAGETDHSANEPQDADDMDEQITEMREELEDREE